MYVSKERSKNTFLQRIKEIVKDYDQSRKKVDL